MKAANFFSRVLRRWLSNAMICVVCFAAVGGTALSQERQPESQNVDDLIESIRQGTFTPAAVNRIVQLRAVQAIPVLKQQFAVNADPLLKKALASALVRLGDPGDEYWSMLVEHAKVAVENNAPFPSAFDAEGKLLPGQLSLEFSAWAKAHNMSPESASTIQVYALPVDLTFLAVTGDPRGLALLRQGLSSRNYFVQAVAAKGLAKLRDTNSVPMIIAACKKAPAQAAELIARALVFFDDPGAQAAAETFITNQQVLGALRKLSRERGPAGVF
jgi:hypothetical protein